MDNKLLNYYLWLLGKRDYSEFKLKKKALEKNYKALDIEKCLDTLRAKNLINDFRYSQNLVEKYKPSKGRAWIENRLKTEGISEDNISKALLDFETSDENFSLLKIKLARKYKVEKWVNIDFKLKQKIVGWLSRNGHSQPFEILLKWEREEGESD